MADSHKYSSEPLHVCDICDCMVAMLLCQLSATLQEKVCHSICGCCYIVVLDIITVIIIITIIIITIIVGSLFFV